jgi:hypothetical protein
MNFLQRPARRGFRITERRTQASGNGHPVASPVRVSEAQVRWPLRFPIAALLLFTAVSKVVNASGILAENGLLASSPPLLLVGIAFGRQVLPLCPIGWNNSAPHRGKSLCRLVSVLASCSPTARDCLPRARGPPLRITACPSLESDLRDVPSDESDGDCQLGTHFHYQFSSQGSNHEPIYYFHARPARRATTIYGTDAAPGQIVVSDEELMSVTGAACIGQHLDLQWICYGSAGQKPSDCTGCGCTLDYFTSTTRPQVYGPTLAPCGTDPHCTTIFARGTCSGSP